MFCPATTVANAATGTWIPHVGDMYGNVLYWEYKNADGNYIKDGWAYIDGYWYYFDYYTVTAQAQTKQIGDRLFLFNDQGQLVTNRYFWYGHNVPYWYWIDENGYWNITNYTYDSLPSQYSYLKY